MTTVEGEIGVGRVRSHSLAKVDFVAVATIFEPDRIVTELEVKMAVQPCWQNTEMPKRECWRTESGKMCTGNGGGRKGKCIYPAEMEVIC